MNYRKKTKAQLIEELEALRKKVGELESGKDYPKPSKAAIENKGKTFYPPGHDGEDLEELADIIDVQSIQSLMNNFYDLTRIPVSIIDLKGRVLVGVGWQDICTKFHRVHPETCKNCIESDITLSAGVPEGEFKLYKCKNNMWDVATPIMVGGRHVGNVFSGQFFFDDEQPDYEFFRSQAAKFGFPEKEYLSALRSVQRLSRGSLDAGMAFFVKLAQMISLLSYSNVQLNRSLMERDALMDSLRATKNDIREMFENSSLGIYRTTPSGRFLNANPALARIYGYDSPKELMNCVTDVGKQLYVDSEARKQWISLINKYNFAVFESQMRKKDGSTCWVRQRAQAVRNADGDTIYYEGFTEDITDLKKVQEELKQYRDHLEALVRERTIQLEEKNRLLMSEIAERKKAEEALRESENTYRTIFENTGNATLFYGEDTRITLVNTEFLKMFKYSRDEIEGKKSWVDLILREDLERLSEYHRLRGIDPDAVPRNYELRLVDRYGNFRDVYMTIAMIPGTQKRVASILDITPLKEAEKALRKSEMHYRLLLENAGVAIANVDAEGRHLSFNDNLVEFTGYRRQELAVIKSSDITHPDYLEKIENLKSRQIRGEIDQFTAEKCYIRKDGSLRWGELKATPIRDEQGNFLSAVLVINDITEQKQAEKELKKYVEEITDLYENAPCGYHSLGPDGTFLRINKTELAWLGYTREEMIGKMKLPDLLKKEEKETFRQKFSLFKKRGWAINQEYSLIRKDGSLLPVLINATAVYDENGNFLISRGSLFDNTERKRMENALIANEALYRNLFENAAIGMFQSSIEGRFLRINKAFAKMLGYESPEEVISSITDTATQIHADPGNRDVLLSALKKQEWFYAEQPYLRKDGSIMTGKISIRRVLRSDGDVAYLEGIVEDVTERKKAEAALQERERELQVKAKNLEEVNTTLKVLLNALESDKAELEGKVLVNIKDQVFPYLDKLKKTSPTDEQLRYINAVKERLHDLFSPFIHDLTSRYLDLTPKELLVASLIKEGKTTKEIEAHLNMTSRTVCFHRENLRKKLGLNKTKVNLQTFLMFLSKKDN